MNEYLPILRSALKDQIIPDLVCICPASKSQLEKIIYKLPNDAVISEWKYIIGSVKYVYHIHNNGLKQKLNEAFNNGVRGGNPKLVKLYSKKEIEKIIFEFGDLKVK